MHAQAETRNMYMQWLKERRMGRKREDEENRFENRDAQQTIWGWAGWGVVGGYFVRIGEFLSRTSHDN